MTPGPDQIVACPHCGGLAKYLTLYSGNTFGARAWTDGKQIAPMLPRPPAVVNCRHCAKCYWLDDADEIGEMERWGVPSKTVDPAWHAAEDVVEPSEAKYYEAIEGGLAADPSEEKQLRILAFQRGNDAFRKDPDAEAGDEAAPPPAPPETRARNLEIVARMLDETDDGELIMKAEVLRELGHFPAALYYLDRVGSSEYDWAVRQIRSLCENREPRVQEMSFDDK